MTHLKRAEGCRVPIYEYDCQGCRRRVSLLIRTLHGGESPRCPRCGSTDTERLSAFGSTACKALYRCRACREPFEHFKPF